MLHYNLLLDTMIMSFCMVSAIKSTGVTKKQKYYFMVYSNPVTGKEDAYLEWYEGQHIHDLLRIPGFVAAQFFRLSDTQFDGQQPHRYMMIWEIETDDLPSVFAEVNARLADGRTVFSDAFDPAYNTITMLPISRRVTAEEIGGKSVSEVGAIARDEQGGSIGNEAGR